MEWKEFRILLLYIRQYLELYVMFDAIDTSGDKRIEEAEFAAALGLVEKWSLKVDDAAATFKELDADGGGMVLFDEFAHWAIGKQLDLDDDDDAEDAGAGSGLIQDILPMKQALVPRGEPAQEKAKLEVDWAAVAKKLAFGKDEESTKRRKTMFRQFDPNGNGLLSLAEVDKAVCEDLQMGDIISKPVLIRAFNAAKGHNKVAHYF